MVHCIQLNCQNGFKKKQTDAQSTDNTGRLKRAEELGGSQNSQPDVDELGSANCEAS